MMYAPLDCINLHDYKLKGNVLKSPGYNEIVSMVHLEEAGSVSSGGSWTIADHERHY